jgi:Tfp pilus assembly protein PilF
MIEATKLLSEGSYLEANKKFDEVLAKDPRNASAQLGKGMAYYSLGNDKLAIRYFDLAISSDSNYEDAYKAKGMVLLSSENFNESADCFSQTAHPAASSGACSRRLPSFEI